jgi:iron complex transport system substrate-binding protein
MQLKYIFVILLLATKLFSYERIIALSPSINEIIYALDSGDKIVGNTQYCNFPKESQNKPKVGGFFSPSLEKIIALKPDMVVMQDTGVKLASKLQKLGIKTTIVKNTRLKDIKDTIKILGELLNQKQKASKLVQTIDLKLEQLQGNIENKKILFVIGHNLTLNKRIFVAGQNLYFDDIIQKSGNRNAYQSALKGQPVLNLENIIATNPDIVVLLAPFTHKKGLTKKELIKPWLSLPINAVKTNTIYVLDKHYAGIPSQRLIYFLEDLKGFLQDARDKQL